MAAQKLIRWSAIAWLLSGLMGIISIVLTPSDFAANAVLSGPWTPIHAVNTFSYMLFMFGLVGVYLAQAEKAGRLGLIGFALTFLGVLLLTVQVAVATWILPVIALQPNAPLTAFELLDPAGPLAAFSLVFFIAYVPAGIGLILFSIATMRAGVLPRMAAVLLMIGTVLALGILVGAPGELIVKLGDFIFDVGKLWIAYALWSGTREAASKAVLRAIPAS
jgi:hypothetical protein